jgi:glycerol kinase
MQHLANILSSPVDRAATLETTALGAAWLAGSKAGVWPGQEAFARAWARDRSFEPDMADVDRQARIVGWRNAVARTLSTVT